MNDPPPVELCRHADVARAALDPAVFSSRASRHLNVPNGMDGEEHRRFRALVDRYFEPRDVAGLEPRIRQLAAELARALPTDRPIDAVGEIGARFAVRAQSSWLSWPRELEGTLLAWMRDNREATRRRAVEQTAAVAARFDQIIRSLLERARAGEGVDDVASRLLSERIDGRPLREEEIVSILRNWTAGDLGSIAACIGVVAHRLASDGDLQVRWRSGELDRPRLEAEIDEVLRIDDPFTFNRRVVTEDVEIGGQTVRAGQQVRLNWAAANRDPEAMGDPDAFRPQENAPRNLVYGLGPHTCPGRGLATLQLRVMAEELLAASSRLELAPDAEPVRETPPYGGFRVVPLIKRVNPDPV